MLIGRLPNGSLPCRAVFLRFLEKRTTPRWGRGMDGKPVVGDNAVGSRLRLATEHQSLRRPATSLTCKTAFTASRLLANGEQGRPLCRM